MSEDVFLPADKLKISTREHGALIEVLDMLESGKLRYADETEQGEYLFNMRTTGQDGESVPISCDTPACIGGWTAFLMGVPRLAYVGRYGLLLRRSYSQDSKGLQDLYWNSHAIHGEVTTGQAATALRNFLKTGWPDWEAVLGIEEDEDFE